MGNRFLEGYGRLYNWSSAMRACPPGWRLPTENEWKKLAMKFGGYFDVQSQAEVGDSNKAYRNLIEGGTSGLNLRLGGSRYTNGEMAYHGSDGLYWSETELHGNRDFAWKYYLRLNTRISRLPDNKANGFSCRCVQG